MKKLFISISLSLIIGISLFFSVQKNTIFSSKNNISQRLSKIPQEDRFFLEYFFRFVLSKEPFSYVLFGDKPIATASIPLEKKFSWHWMPSFEKTRPKKSILKKGWEVWQKYENLFPSSNYIIRGISNGNDEILTILLINKRNFLKSFEAHFEVFANIFGPNITGLELLKKFTMENPFDEKARKHDTATLGILYGFGKHNALLFQRRNEIKERRGQRTTIKTQNFSKDKELKNLNQHLQYFGDPRPNDELLFMLLPMFVADYEHEETKVLKKKYTSDRKRITQIYGRGNFLEVALEQFLAP